MNELLQKHGCSNVFTVPEGLRELMSDISREVLREQPSKIYDFITNYLSALLITREHGLMAVKILEDLCDCRATVSEHLLQLGFVKEDAENLAEIIREQVENFEPSEGREKVSEIELIRTILKEKPLDEEKIVEVCQVARNAYRDYWYRKNLLKQGLKMQPDEPWEIAAQHTLELYKKTKPSFTELTRASQKIQAAYRGYYTRQHMLKFMAKPKKQGPRVELSGPPLDTAASREIDLGRVIDIKSEVFEDNVDLMFDEHVGESLGLKYDPMKTITLQSDSAVARKHVEGLMAASKSQAEGLVTSKSLAGGLVSSKSLAGGLVSSKSQAEGLVSAAKSQAGGLVSSKSQGEGLVSAAKSQAGGLVSSKSQGEGLVSAAKSQAGGLVSSKSQAEGLVSAAKSQAGGLVSSKSQGEGLVSAAKSQAGGLVSSKSLAGGLVSASKSQAEGLVSGAKSQAGGLVSGAKSQAGGLVPSSESQAEGLMPGAKSQAGGLVSGAKSQAEGLVSGAKSQAGGLVTASKSQAEGLVSGAKSQAGGLMTASKSTASAFQVIQAPPGDSTAAPSPSTVSVKAPTSADATDHED